MTCVSSDAWPFSQKKKTPKRPWNRPVDVGSRPPNSPFKAVLPWANWIDLRPCSGWASPCSPDSLQTNILVLWGKWGCPRGAWIEWCISCRTRNAVTWTSWCSRQSAVTIVRSHLQTAPNCEIMLSTVGLHAENAIANSNISPYWRGTKGTPDVTLSRGQRRSVTSAGQTLTSRPHTQPISSCVAMREYTGHHPHHIRTPWMGRTDIWWKEEAKVSCPREQSETSFRGWEKWNPVPAINCLQLIYKGSFIYHTMVRSH